MLLLGSSWLRVRWGGVWIFVSCITYLFVGLGWFTFGLVFDSFLPFVFLVVSGLEG